MANVFEINMFEFQTRSNGDQMVACIVKHLSMVVWVYLMIFVLIDNYGIWRFFPIFVCLIVIFFFLMLYFSINTKS